MQKIHGSRQKAEAVLTEEEVFLAGLIEDIPNIGSPYDSEGSNGKGVQRKRKARVSCSELVVSSFNTLPEL